LENVSRELRRAVRSLRRSPGFAVAVVAILALGVGANTAIYGVVRAVLLRPLSYPSPERLVMVLGSHHPNAMGEEIAAGNFLDLRRDNAAFDDLGVFGPRTLDAIADGRPERWQAAQVSPGALRALGTRPLFGRMFLPEEERVDARVAILTYGLWERRFGGDRSVLGRTVRLSGSAYEVVGILPREFRMPRRLGREVELLLPLRFTPERSRDRQSRWLYAIGRLASGISVEAAQREMDSRTATLARDFPVDNQGWGVRVVPLREEIVGRVRPALRILLAASLLVLVAACANIGNLLLARAAARRGEMGVRAALGASRRDLLRPVLAEGMMLSAAGGLAGVPLGGGCLHLLIAAAPAGIPRLEEAHLDPGVLAFAFGVSILAGLVFGLAPALASWRAAPAAGLRLDGRGGAGPGGARVRRLVTVAEVATALILLVGAALLLSSLARLLRVEPGFDGSNVTTMEVVLTAPRYSEDTPRSGFFRELADRAGRLPGVVSAGGVSHLPLTGSNSTDGYVVEDRPPSDPNDIPEAAVRAATPRYFRTLSVPMLAGRDFSAGDRAGSPPVVLVNRAFADRYWGVAGAVGKRIRFAGSSGRSAPLEVIGVVGDIRHAALDAPAVPEIYVAYEQSPYDAMVLVVKSRPRAPSPAAALRDVVARLDPEQPVSSLRTMEAVLAQSTSEPRFYAELVAAFAALAIALAAAGISSVIAYSAAQRRREIGIRLALGAQRGHVVGLVLKEAAALGAWGIAAGMLVAAFAARSLAGLLFGVRPQDPGIFAAAAALLAAVVLAASLVPAVASSRVSPLTALKSAIS
jgi:putative ABC transport system permease protein